MTRLDTKALRALHEAATPGPWEWDPAREMDPNDPDDAGRPPHVPQGAHLGDTLIGMDDTYERSDYDAALIAAMRNQLPALLDRIAKLEAVAKAAGKHRYLQPPPGMTYRDELDAALAALETP